MESGLGIIGAGGIGRVHAQGAADAGCPVSVFCDTDLDKAAEAAEPWSADTVGSVDELLSRDDVTRVVVAVPNALHMPLAIEALKAGKDVLLEKPMALNEAQCNAILDAHADSGALLQVGFVCRYAATSQLARRVIQQGALGDIYHAKAVMLRRRGIPGLGRWFTTKADSGGGVLIDLGPHLSDLVLHLMGRPRVEQVHAMVSSTFGSPPDSYKFTNMWAGPPELEGDFDVEDAAIALMRCEGGASVCLETSWASHLPDGTIGDGVTLMGTKGAMHFDIWGDHVLVGGEIGGEMSDSKLPIPEGEGWGTAFKREHECFAKSCATRTLEGPSGAEGQAIQCLLDGFYRSVAEGTAVTL
ncbi:MAG: Gfo/Idh/MocA family oxidoreductase [Phycisphaerales bacterium]|nr:Gfo/Idh/MocA family oxidoreductase [Phycisphaerales bacterium]